MSLENSAIGKKAFEYLNEIRVNSKKAIEDLNQLKQFYKDKFYCNPSLPVIVETKEGTAAIEDAIAFLQKMEPVSRLVWDDTLVKTSASLIDLFEKQGAVSHGQKDLSFTKRIGEQNRSNSRSAENIALGRNDPKDIVLSMVIDDGLTSRRNRLNLFDAGFSKVAIVIGGHKDHRYACIISLKGETIKDTKSMDKYWIPKDRWPIDAISVDKHFEVVDEDSKRSVIARFEFTHANGTKTVQTQEFNN